MTRDTGQDRRECIVWIVYPRYVGTASEILPVRAAEVRESADALGWLQCQLDQLICVAQVSIHPRLTYGQSLAPLQVPLWHRVHKSIEVSRTEGDHGNWLPQS